MNRIKQLVGEGRAIFASVLCLLSCVLLLAPSALAADSTPNYLTFTAEQANSTVTFKFGEGEAQYSTNGGSSWNDIDGYEGVTITLAKVGDKVVFKGSGVKTSMGRNHFSMTGKISASGDVTSLTNGTGGDATLANECYNSMFYECTALTRAPALPATTLAKKCYFNMFYGCTALTAAPKLPATKLAESCYNSMFYGCTALTDVPALNATTLANDCCYQMFNTCTSLTHAPALPTTTLADGCYKYMFGDCKALTHAPTLPATTLAIGCYNGMFSGCTSLKTVPELPAETLENYCYYNMFIGCTSLEVNKTTPGKEWKIPVATTTAENWGKDMFKSIKTGSTVPATPDCNTTYYVASAPVTVVVPEVAGATAQLYAFDVNGGWKAVDTYAVPIRSTVRVVWTADEGKGLWTNGVESAYQWQTAFGPVVGGEIAPAPEVREAGASEVSLDLDTRTKKSYFDAKDILPVWYAAGVEVQAKGEGEQSWTTLVKSSATNDTVRWTPPAPDTYALSHVGFENATIIYTLPVEVTTNDLAVAGATVAVTDEAGQPLVAQTEGELAGKLIVSSNSMITVTWTATEKGTYFADGSTTYSQKFKAGKSVNPASESVEAPKAPAAPSVMLGVVAQRYPWNGQLDVGYLAKNTPNGYQIKVTVTLPDGTSASQESDAKNGKNTATFDAEQAFGEVKFTTGVTVTAELVEQED